MQKMMNGLVWIVSIFMMLAVILSCGKAKEAAVEKAIEAGAAANGQKVDVDLSGKKMTVKSEDGTYTTDGNKTTMTTSDGTTQIEGNSMEMTSNGGKTHMTTGDKAAVPADFPKDVPLYPGAKVSMAMTDADSGSTSLQFETSDAVDKVAEYVTKESAAQGWKNDTEIKTGGDQPMHMLGMTKDSRKVVYTIQGTGSATQINMSLETEGTAQPPSEEPQPEEPAPAATEPAPQQPATAQ